MTLQMWLVSVALLGLSAALVCPDGGMCEDRNTCCKDAAGGYECCPLPRAECCSDHLHCCYEGTVCDLVHAKCVNKTVSLPWTSRLPAKRNLLVPQLGEGVKAVICPDQESECPDDTTCCQLLDGSWGCCPLAKAVCCEDKLHCCPEGTKCDITHSKCVASSLLSFPLLEKLPARRRQDEAAHSAVTCPGGTSSCPDSFTCCLLTSGDYGCCPYPEAVCCSDHLHCCPANTVCDLERGVCKSGETHELLLLLKKKKKVAAAPNDVECPDRKTACPDQTTCCQMSDGTYGCCPMPNAVCCSDHLHCCPEGTRCDLAHSACVVARRPSSAAVRIAAAVTPAARSEVGAVPCNDSVACADKNTCCQTLGGEWACCPLPKAVCCDDRLHCCPHGTVCNLEASTCDDPAGGAVMPWLSKTLAFPSANGKCDDTTSCPGKSTCCRTLSGGWACCPLPRAVCCDDHAHCCPHGTVCNLQEETCDDPAGFLPPLRWAAKLPALASEAALQEELAVSGPSGSDRNMCDARTSCPRDTTCCFMDQTHEWGCCPLPDAVCCLDGSHCCPRGHSCEPHRSSCSKGARVLPWFTKVGALSEPAALTDVKCDDKSSCATGTTCCKLQTGEWGCCPLVKAVCCADHEHCCPQGYTCNMQTGTCEKKNLDALLHSLPQSQVVRSRPADDASYVPCDAAEKFHCSRTETCCKISTSAWACCPSPQAVCCLDAKHCCPAGTSCNLETGGCSGAPPTWDTLIRDPKKDVFL